MDRSNIIVKSVFGSHLYGTSTPESDQDFKVVFMPTWEQIVLNRVPRIANESTGLAHMKNTNKDKDTEIFSIYEFVRLACDGQTAQMDMLHTPKELLIHTSPIWEEIVANREKFYSKNIVSFCGYAKTQATKYSVKGDRMNCAKKVLDWFNNALTISRATTGYADMPMSDSDLSTFPTDEHIIFHPGTFDPKGNKIMPMYEVCNRKLTVSASLLYNKAIVKKFYDDYGARAKQAATNEGADWKAFSHAFRAVYQAIELFKNGTMTMPRPEAEFLLKVKTGQLEMKNLVPMLDDLLEQANQLRATSTLPEQPDREFWDKFLISKVEQNVVPANKIMMALHKESRKAQQQAIFHPQ